MKPPYLQLMELSEKYVRQVRQILDLGSQLVSCEDSGVQAAFHEQYKVQRQANQALYMQIQTLLRITQN